MKTQPFIFTILLLLTGCEMPKGGDYKSPSSEEFAKDHPGAFDTIICENGDTVLVCNMAIDSIM